MLLGRIEIAGLLTLLYLMISANFEPRNVVVGVVIGISLTALLRPRWRGETTGALYTRLLTLVRYNFKLGWEVFINGLYVARIVLTPSLPIHPGIIRIKPGCDEEALQAISAHGISITPGEIVMKISEQGDFYIHCVDVRKSRPTAQNHQVQRLETLRKIFA